MSVASTDLQPREVKIELDSSQLFSQDEQVAPSNDGLDSPVDDTPGAALQKRRRVTRACDECRKKKIRCDGKHPCTHCTVYGYGCSYDQPSNRRRNPAPLFLEAMEKKLRRAEALLQICFPGVGLEDPRLDTLLKKGSLSEGGLKTMQAQLNGVDVQRASDTNNQEHDSDLESMLTMKGALNQDEQGEYAYYGASSGMNFLRSMSEVFGNMAESKTRDQSNQSTTTSSRRMSNVMMEIPGESNKHDATSEHDISIDDLPPKETARRLVRYALDDACAIVPCVHQPSFYTSFDRIYDISTDNYNTQDQRFLPLLYVVIALGCLFAKDEESKLEKSGYLSATDEGYKYFWAARQLMDVTDCRDLVSLQALIFMILFLQCSAKLATCYAFIGVAIRCALRMGMHRTFNDSFDPIESEVRKRCFWIIRKMDVMVSAMLGLPLTLSDHDIDQEFPTEVDDEYITLDGIRSQPAGTVSLITAVNHDFRLTNIVCKLVRCVYPVKGFQSGEQEASRLHRVRLSVVKGIESDLKLWEDNLQREFKPGHETTPKLMRIRNLLRMGFAYVQMMLYRPFLHYVSARSHRGRIQPSSQACAAACVHVSRNIIHITASMNQNGLLVGSYWFTMYSSFFAVLSLVFYALENVGVSQDTMNDAIVGRQTLASLAKRSMAADRCSLTLTVLFDQLQWKINGLDSSKRQANSSKKRNSSQIGSRSSIIDTTGRASSNTGKLTTRPHNQPSTTQTPGFQTRPTPLQQYQEPVSPDAMLSPQSTQGQQNMVFPGQSQLPIHTPQSPADVQMAPFAVPTQQGFHHPEGEHFSRMMFPSSDPFAYPNPPMLALDRSGAMTQPQATFGGVPAPVISTTTTAPTDIVQNDDFMDVNMLGIPNYPNMDQAQQRSNAQFVPGIGVCTNAPVPSQYAIDGSNNFFPGFNVGEFFGSGDWQQ